jgi:hypothetical protein
MEVAALVLRGRWGDCTQLVGCRRPGAAHGVLAADDLSAALIYSPLSPAAVLQSTTQSALSLSRATSGRCGWRLMPPSAVPLWHDLCCTSFIDTARPGKQTYVEPLQIKVSVIASFGSNLWATSRSILLGS